MPPRPQPPTSKPKGGLRSPLLGGDEIDDEPPQSPGGKRKGGLRSPLLSGDDDEPPAAPRKGLRSPLLDDEEITGGKGKGGLRSPLLRGDDDEGDRTPFPHRSKGAGDDDWQPRPYPPKGGLRSPLLGGSDDDSFDDEPRAPRNKPGSTTGGRQRLHSPVLGSGGDEYYDDYEDEEPYDDDDPNVLRSPLLAARQKLPTEKPAPKPAPAPPQAPAPQPAPAQNPQQARPPQGQLGQVDYGWGTKQAGQPDPYLQQPSAPYGAPQPQTLQPSPYSPQPAQQQPQQQQWPAAKSDFAQPAPSPNQADTPPKPIPAYQTTRPAEPPPAPKSRGRSALLDDEPQSRPSFDRFSSDSDQYRPLRSSPSMVLIIPCVLALLAHGMSVMDTMKTANLPMSYVADQLGITVLIIGLIIFGMTANKK